VVESSLCALKKQLQHQNLCRVSQTAAVVKIATKKKKQTQKNNTRLQTYV